MTTDTRITAIPEGGEFISQVSIKQGSLLTLSAIRVITWSLLLLAIFGLGLPYFDFWSDDLGYFSNFHNVVARGVDVKSLLASYLTGGVPRLQLGWHVTHQLLYLVFGHAIWLYFLVEVLLLGVNTILFEKLLRPLYGPRVSFWASTLLLVSPFYRETFYWVSANYGFFQLFFFLSACLLLEWAHINVGMRRWLGISLAAVCVVASILYQEQTATFLFFFPIFFILIKKEGQTLRGRIKPAVQCFIVSIIFFVLLFIPQFLVINTSGSTSLIDSFNQYYPHPIDSITVNAPKILRMCIMGVFPELAEFYALLNNYSRLPNAYVSLILVGTLCIFIAAILGARATALSKSALAKFNWSATIAFILWILAASVIVLPLGEFLSRYVYIILAPCAALVTVLIVSLLRRFSALVLSPLLIVNSIVALSFYYGSHFPLVRLERLAYQQVTEFTAQKPQLRAMVFKDFPTTLNSAVSGVWINYHATEWWLSWNALPERTEIRTVGNDYVPVLAHYGSDDIVSPSGFRVMFGDYPLSRLKQVFSPEQIAIVEFTGSVFDETPRLNFIYRNVIERELTNEVLVLNNGRPTLDLPLPNDISDLRNCYLDIVADISSAGVAGGFQLYTQSGKVVDYTAGYSTGATTNFETAFVRTVIKENGPYFLRLFRQPLPVVNPANNSTADVSFKNVKIYGCGKEFVADRFIASHNPDPKYPYQRWVSPQSNYSVTFPYEGSEVWEAQYTVGVNDSQNRGDYYCFPDDNGVVKLESGQQFKAYLGMLQWRREVVNSGNKLSVIFSRSHGDPVNERKKLDIMPLEEWKQYYRDDMPVDLTVQHDFDLNKNYYIVTVKVKSQSSEAMKFRYSFEDASVFDFAYGSDAGVETMLYSGKEKMKAFFSGRGSQFNDLALYYRKMYPRRYNLGVFEYSTSPYFNGTFLALDSKQSIRDIADDQLPKSLVLGRDLPLNGVPGEKAHGLWFDVPLLPGEEKSFTYNKAMLSGFYDEEELLYQASELIKQFNAHN